MTEILRPDPDGVGTLSRPKTEYGYDAAGNLASIGESRFGTAPYEYTYDDAGRKTRLDRDGLTSVTYTYDNLNRLIESKVGEQYGLETRYEYNWRGQATSIMEIGYEVLPEGILSPTLLDRTWTLGYDDAGQLLEEIDPRGNVTAYVYNSRGLVSEIYAPDPDGSSPETSGPQLPSRTSFEYDDMGRLIAIQDALLRTTSYAYNARDWVTQVTLPDPDGTGSQTSATISMTYDDAGNVLTETDPLSQVTTYTYDAEGRLLTITGPDPDGTGSLSQPVMTYTYNAVGSVLTLTEPGGAETSWDYDHLQRVIEITEPDPDGTGSLTSPVTTIEYGSNTLISQITDPLSRETTFQYDSYGNRTSITDDAGNTTTYTYNDEHLVTSVLAPDPDGAGPQAAPETEYTYNVFHQVIAAIDPNDGMTVYEYDDAGNLISLTDPEENETTFAYDGQGRLTLETNEQGDYRSYQYDLAGNLTRLRDRNGRVLRYYYDNLDQMTSETWRSSADPGPELEIETTSQGGPVDEVQRVGYTDMMLFGGTFTLTYSGQTTAAISHGASAATVQTALEALSNIDSGDVSVTKSADTFEEQEWTIEYQGSLAGTNVSQMTIDASNILGGMGTLVETEATDTQGSQTGASETQTVTLSNATGGTFRLASGGYLTADLDYDATASEVETALEALNAIDDVTVTGSAGGPWTIVYGGDQAGEDVSRLDGDVVDQVLAQEDVSKTLSDTQRVLWPLVDNLGTVRDLAKQDGTIAVHYKYDAYGNVTSGDTSKTRYLFTAREFDTDIDLQYNRARWYDPEVGRWISEDPIGLLAGDANLDRCVENGPTNSTDPSGLRKRRPGQITAGDIMADMGIRNPGMRPIIEQREDAIQQGLAIGRAGQRMFGDGAGLLIPINATEIITGRDVFNPNAVELTPGEQVRRGVEIGICVLPAFLDEILEFGKGIFKQIIRRGGDVGDIARVAPKPAVARLDDAFHYTVREWGDVIKRQGLRPGSYATPNGNLSGLGAKLELALPPTRSAPDIRIRIDLEGLRKAGYEIPTTKRVSNVVKGPGGRIYTMPGGGYEIQFPYEVPGEFLEVLPLEVLPQ